MSITITIDGVGRLVIPKAVRERYRLSEGSRLRLSEEDGHFVLTPDSPAPMLVERGGLLVLDLGHAIETTGGHLSSRDERMQSLMSYALKR